MKYYFCPIIHIWYIFHETDIVIFACKNLKLTHSHFYCVVCHPLYYIFYLTYETEHLGELILFLVCENSMKICVCVSRILSLTKSPILVYLLDMITF